MLRSFLVLDSDPNIAQTVAGWLCEREAGVAVFPVHTVADARELLTRGPRFDMAIIDATPDPTELGIKVGKEYLGLGTIPAFTTPFKPVGQYLEDLGVHCFTKPVALKEITDYVERILDSSSQRFLQSVRSGMARSLEKVDEGKILAHMPGAGELARPPLCVKNPGHLRNY